ENSGALTGVSESTAIARLKGLTSGYTAVAARKLSKVSSNFGVGALN
ncbi:hypothetical protein Gpo141_00014326, partial [Globisporangium polare]